MIWIRKYNCYTKITSEAWLHADLTLGKEEVRIFFIVFMNYFSMEIHFDVNFVNRSIT